MWAVPCLSSRTPAEGCCVTRPDLSQPAGIYEKVEAGIHEKVDTAVWTVRRRSLLSPVPVKVLRAIEPITALGPARPGGRRGTRKARRSDRARWAQNATIKRIVPQMTRYVK